MSKYLFIILLILPIYAEDVGLIESGVYDVVLARITKVHDSKPSIIWNDLSNAETKGKGLYKFEYQIEEFLYVRNPNALEKRNETLYPNLYLHSDSCLWVTENLNPMVFSGLKEGDRLILVISKSSPFFESICARKISIDQKETVMNAIIKAIKSDLVYYEKWMNANKKAVEK